MQRQEGVRPPVRIAPNDGATIYTYYHNDADGRFAGWCSWYFNDIGKKLPHHMSGVQYNTKCDLLDIMFENLKSGDQVYVVDFSFPVELLDRIVAAGANLQVLDHHSKIDEAIKDHPNVWFDNTMSGALLAWHYFFPGEVPPWACKYVNDRDLWKWEFGAATAHFASYLNAYEVKSDWEAWTLLAFASLSEMKVVLDKGKAVYEYEQVLARNFAKKAVLVDMIIAGEVHKVAVLEGMGILTSEIGAEVYKNHAPIYFEWRNRGNHVSISMRSNSVDIGEVAKSHGGGGHAAAAGFSMNLNALHHLLWHLGQENPTVDLDRLMKLPDLGSTYYLKLYSEEITE